MRAGDAALQAEPLRLVGQRLDVARQRIVGLVAMHVDEQPALLRRSRRAPSGSRRRRPSCARNAGCRRRHRRPCRARARDSSPRSASGNSRPAGRRRAAGRYRARSAASPRAARRRRSAGRRRCRHACGWRAGPSTRRGRNSGARAPSPPRRSAAASARPRARCLRAACRTGSCRGRPSDSVASMWKWQSTKGGETSRPVASMMRPASAAMLGSIAAIFPPAQAMSMPSRPSGSVGVRDDQVEGHHRSSLRNGTSSAAGARALRETSAMATMVMTKGSIRNTW